MAGASDKARFYLEKSSHLQELHELEKKGIFSKKEISRIVKTRSDFEHKINSRESRPLDFARYAEYEMNLDALRLQRAERIGAKVPGYGGQRRIIFILDRATQKFYGNLDLWIQYVDYAKKQKAYKRVTQILTRMVRLQPTNPDVWMYAASYFINEQGDMMEARSYMQRGLRFCKNSKQLWLDYAKLELLYINKIALRRRILGAEKEPAKMQDAEGEDHNSDVIALPTVTAEDIDPNLRNEGKEDELALKSMEEVPALSGAIPMAIFDSAMASFSDAELGAQFFDVAMEFESIPTLRVILQHIVDRMLLLAPKSHLTLDMIIRQPLATTPPTAAEFPDALRKAISKYEDASKECTSRLLPLKTCFWLVRYLQLDLDENIRSVLASMLSKCLRQYGKLSESEQAFQEEEIEELSNELLQANMAHSASRLVSWAVARLPQSEKMLQLESRCREGSSLETQS